MRIGIDARMVTSVIDGAGRVMMSLLARLENYPEHDFVVFYRNENAVFSGVRNVEYIKADIPVSTLENLFLLHRIVNRQKLDLFYYSFVDVPLFINVPVVTEVFDLFYMYDRAYFSSRKRRIYHLIRLMTWVGLLRSSMIIAISEVTACQVKKLPLMKRKPLKVVHLAMYEELLYQDKQSLPEGLFENGYVLYVGNNRQHKNLTRLIQAFGYLNTEMKLVLAGKIDSRYANPKEEISRCKLNDKVLHIGPVDDAMLATLYRCSRFVVVPSLYEGFGLPALEAASFNKAVLCSDIDALREVMGEATIYFDPLDIESIVLGLRRLFEDNEYCVKIAAQCKERSGHYTEKKFADETITALAHMV